jgi:hypothetical protein
MNTNFMLFQRITHGAEPLLRSCQLCSYSRTSQHFMKPKGSLLCSQELVHILSQTNSIHTIPSYLSKIQSQRILVFLYNRVSNIPSTWFSISLALALNTSKIQLVPVHCSLPCQQTNSSISTIAKTAESTVKNYCPIWHSISTVELLKACSFMGQQ